MKVLRIVLRVLKILVGLHDYASQRKRAREQQQQGAGMLKTDQQALGDCALQTDQQTEGSCKCETCTCKTPETSKNDEYGK